MSIVFFCSDSDDDANSVCSQMSQLPPGVKEEDLNLYNEAKKVALVVSTAPTTAPVRMQFVSFLVIAVVFSDAWSAGCCSQLRAPSHPRPVPSLHRVWKVRDQHVVLGAIPARVLTVRDYIIQEVCRNSPQTQLVSFVLLVSDSPKCTSVSSV